MNKLTCEMCGSTDLIKDGGVFVCQNCGTKYSVEEAKKMMVEGTVTVQGTVKIDNSEAYASYIQLINDAFEDGRFDSAYSAIMEAIKITPESSILISRQALAILGREGFLNAIPSATTKGIDRALDICWKTHSPKEMLAFSQALGRDVNMVCAHLMSIMIDEKKTLDAERMQLRKTVDQLADLVEPVFVAAQNQRDDQIKAEHNRRIDAKISAVNRRMAILEEFRKKYVYLSTQYFQIAQKRAIEEQMARNAAYWQEHAAERVEIEGKISELEAKIRELDGSIFAAENERLRLVRVIGGATAGEVEIYSLNNKRNELLTRHANLGVFKSKEKQQIKDEIAAIDAKIMKIGQTVPAQKSAIRAELQPKVDEIVKQVTPLQQERGDLVRQVQELKNELTKNR